MKLLAFSTSGSSVSINKKLVTGVLKHFTEFEIDFVDLNDYDMTIYTPDKEEKHGIPSPAILFASKVDVADLIIMSHAEHNGAYTALFKNLLDWLSRIPGRSAFNDTKMFLLAASPGARGGSGVLQMAANRFPFNGGKVIETYSLPFFEEYFIEGKGVVHEEKEQELLSKIHLVKQATGL